MLNERAEHKRDQQTQYGHYCNDVRKLDLKPKPYHQFQDKMDNLDRTNLTKTDIKRELVIWTMHW